MIKVFLSLFYVLLTVACGFTKHGTNNTAANPLSTLLSKFHQNDYKLAFERSELVRSNKNFVNFQIRTFKYNRTTPVVNASYTLKIDVGYDMEVIVQMYRFASNEYRLFPIRLQLNLCEAMATSAMGLGKVSNFGNIKCPLLKGKKYYYYNWTPEELNFPPFIPTGSYMMQAEFECHSNELWVINNYGTVYRPIYVP